MCGIYGVIPLKGMSVRKAVLRQVLKNLARCSQARGTHATGYAFTSSQGVEVFKHNVSAETFFTLDNYKSVVRTGFNQKNLFSVIGHTRHQTKGSHTNTNNNHPILTGDIVGVHNGMIHNDDEIFRQLDEKSEGEIKRIAQVDSEAIFALINYYAKNHKFPEKVTGSKMIGHVSNPTSRAIARAGSELTGSFACACVDAENPSAVWLFRGNGPINVKHYKKEGLVLFASVENYITKSVDVFNFSEPENINIETQSGICINASVNTFNSFEFDTTVNKGWMNRFGGTY